MRQTTGMWLYNENNKSPEVMLNLFVSASSSL